MDETEATERARRGDRDAFAELVAHHQRRVWAIALRMTGDREAAMDLAQEAFLQAWAHMDRFRPGSPFGPWICRIVHNRCLNHLERRRHPAAPRLAGVDEPPEPADPRPFPDERLDQQQMTSELQEHVAELPPILRGAFALRYVDDRPLAEVAAILAVPVNTVKTHLFRAREFLRRRMGRWLHV